MITARVRVTLMTGSKVRVQHVALNHNRMACLCIYLFECVFIYKYIFSAHTQRLLKLQSILRRAPSYRTLELQLIEWQERELFEYFVVVSLKKKPTKNSYAPEVSYQFPKVPCENGESMVGGARAAVSATILMFISVVFKTTSDLQHTVWHESDHT